MKNITPHHYKIIIRDISEGAGEAFEVFVPAFNAYHFGDTVEKAIQSYYLYFESEKKRREALDIPMPASDIVKEKIKQILLRLPESIYEKTLHQSKNMGLSFNSFISKMLENKTSG